MRERIENVRFKQIKRFHANHSWELVEAFEAEQKYVAELEERIGRRNTRIRYLEVTALEAGK